jgi:hypothetical protein
MSIDTIMDRIIAVDYGTVLQDIIAAGKYDWMDNAITPKHFPVEGDGIKKFRTRIFHFGRYISSEDAVVAIEKEMFVTATHVHGLVYSTMFPDDQRKHPIVCLGSSAQVHGNRRIVRLDGSGAGRYLDLGFWGAGWRGISRFLGVQEVFAA